MPKDQTLAKLFNCAWEEISGIFIGIQKEKKKERKKTSSKTHNAWHSIEGYQACHEEESHGLLGGKNINWHSWKSLQCSHKDIKTGVITESYVFKS